MILPSTLAARVMSCVALLSLFGGNPVRAGDEGAAPGAPDSAPQRPNGAVATTASDEPPALALDQVFYVDKQISSSSCTTYNVATRSCSGGTATAYRTLAGAAAVASAGQTVVIRAGTYNEALIPQHSGAPGQPITFQPYSGETASISGGSLCPAIDLSNRSYIVIQGLTVTNVQRWLLAVDASHDTLVGNTFSRALDSAGSSKTGLFFQTSSYNQILNNTITDSTQDNLSFVASDRNLVQGNTFTRAAHTLWCIKCGNQNILRDNYFYNDLQKIGEIYDCDGVGVDHDIFLYNDTKYNVIEDNVFAFTASSGDASPYAGIQYAGQNAIIRRNAFYDTTGPALDMGSGGTEEPYDTDNRIYNNVFYATHFAGIAFNPFGGTLSGNLFQNNILLKSIFVRNDMRWDWYIELEGKPVQVMLRERSGFTLERNDIFDVQAGETYTITYGQRENSNPPQHNVAWWEVNWPALFVDNLEVDPLFVDEDAHDFHLQPGSPLIDAGVFLTHTVGAGSGTTLHVQDAGYFCDGYGIDGETGDLIRLQGSTATAHVVGLDPATNTLTLDASLTWSDGQGVGLNYSGAAPDLGAFERVSSVGDLNCDGAVNFADINPFVLALSGQAAYQAAYPNCNWLSGDCNGDGTVDFIDINAFVGMLTNR